MRTDRLAWVLSALLVLVAVLGLLGLKEDGPAAFRLEADSPLLALNERLRAETGGDRVVLALLQDDLGLLSEEGVARISAVYDLMAASAGLERVQAVHVVPLLESVDGALEASTPLQPPPTEPTSWEAARARVLADSLITGQLVSSDGRAAVVVGWLRDVDEAKSLGTQAQHALSDVEFRNSAAGRAVSTEMNSARMAVVLGESARTVHDEVALRLLGLADRGGPGAGDVRQWQDYSRRLVADPEAVVLSTLQNSLRGQDAGLGSVRLFSPRLVEDAFGRAFRQSALVFLAVLILTLVWFVARLRGLAAAAIAAVLCLVGALATLGAAAWLGLALHPLTAIGALGSSLWLAVLLILRPASRWARLVCGAMLAAPVLLASPGGPGLADLRLTAACGLVVCVLLAEVWCSLKLTRQIGADGPSAFFVALSARSVPFAWLVVLVGSSAMLLGRPLGMDPGAMVAAQDEIGATASLLDDHLGSASGAFLVLDGGGRGAVATPEALRLLASTQERITAHPALRSVVSWSDFIARIHAVVSGSSEGELPDSASLVEQYLLLFNQPERTRMFVSEDLSLAAGSVRTNRRGGAELGFLATLLPAGAGTPALAGESVAMAVAVRRQATGLLVGLLLAALVLTTVLAQMRSRGLGSGLRGGSLAVPATCALFALASCAFVAGSIGAFGVLSGCWVVGVLGSAMWLHARGHSTEIYDVIQLLAIASLPLSLSLATPLRAMGVGMFVASLLAAFLFVPGDEASG